MHSFKKISPSAINIVTLYYVSSGSEEMEVELEEKQTWRGGENDVILQSSIIIIKEIIL